MSLNSAKSLSTGFRSGEYGAAYRYMPSKTLWIVPLTMGV
jgi:hypothetical protein